MCTAVSYRTCDHYFGRNLDLDQFHRETVTVTPRCYPLRFRMAGEMPRHYAMIGMARVIEDYPLYYDATNECGLSMAGLNFPGLAAYFPADQNRDNITPFEFIPWILGQCQTVTQVRELLTRVSLVNIPFSDTLPLSPLHWMICDRNGSITVETTSCGMRVMDNPFGVLTNNPPFEYHAHHLCEYMNVSALPAQNRFSTEVSLAPYSHGMGGMGIPGDLSSASRFVRAAFARLNSVCGPSESESVSQFFHILGFTQQHRGLVRTQDGMYEITQYSSCCNTDKGIYYYTTYENSQITAVNMHRCKLDGKDLIVYPLMTEQQIRMQN